MLKNSIDKLFPKPGHGKSKDKYVAHANKLLNVSRERVCVKIIIKTQTIEGCISATKQPKSNDW